MEKILQLLGLAQRAGKITAGTEQVEKTLTHGRARLLILATDVSPEVKKNLLYICDKTRITSIILCDKSTLGLCIGKGQRVALAIHDRGFADAIMKEVRKSNDGLNTVEVVEWQK